MKHRWRLALILIPALLALVVLSGIRGVFSPFDVFAPLHAPPPCRLFAAWPFIGLEAPYRRVLNAHLRAGGWKRGEYCIVDWTKKGFDSHDFLPGERPADLEAWSDSLDAEVVIEVLKGRTVYAIAIDPVTLTVLPPRVYD